jgi:hypothetical protein
MVVTRTNIVVCTTLMGLLHHFGEAICKTLVEVRLQRFSPLQVLRAGTTEIIADQNL